MRICGFFCGLKEMKVELLDIFFLGDLGGDCFVVALWVVIEVCDLILEIFCRYLFDCGYFVSVVMLSYW